MENKKPLLTICIPTYRGVDYVIQSLGIIVPQLSTATVGVEVIVADNGTPDDDFCRLQDFIDGLDASINLLRHKEDIGGRANFEFAASKAQGKYLFMLGDDDIISPDTIRILTPYLVSDEYSFIHFNTIFADANLKSNYLITKDYNGVAIEMSVAEFLKSNQYDATFSSALVILRECWILGDSHVRDEYYGYEWYGRMMWGAALLGKPCLYYHFPLVIQRNPPKKWEKQRPIFKLIGQGMIWKDLDTIIADLFVTKLRQRNPRVVDILSASMTKDQKYYRQYEKKFKLVLTEKEFKTLKSALYTPFPFFYRVAYNIRTIFEKILSKLNR